MARIVTDFLDKTVENFPEKVFVGDKYEEISYKEIKKRALVVAREIKEYGCYKQPVAIFMDKSVKTIISIFGIAYSGCFYTVVDTKGSINRNEKIFEDLEPALIITDRLNYNNLIDNKSNSVQVLLYDEIEFERISKEDEETEENAILRTDLFCVIYTSGSSGTPKGVAIPHQAVVNYIEDASSDYLNISSDDIFGNQYPFYYIASLDDILLTVRNGASMFIIPEELFFNPLRLVGWLIEKNKCN